jgi:glycosyltransferase involved in cell wall biosynthesis
MISEFLVNCELLKGKLTPYNFELDKIRIGDEGDGGYVCLEGLPEYDCLYSLGSEDKIQFENSFWKLYNKECYVYDHTINGITNKPDWLHFFKTGISNQKTDVFDTIDNILDSNGHTNCKNIMAQIDIEGYEWLILKDTKKITNFSQIIIEFHTINNFKLMNETLDFMNKHFYVVHIHGNNYPLQPWLDGNLPCVYEVTYIRKDLVKHITKNYKSGPDPVLDTPNHMLRPDLPLTWWSLGFGKTYMKKHFHQSDDDTLNTHTFSDYLENYNSWYNDFIKTLPLHSISQLYTTFYTSDVHPDIITEMKKFSRVIVPFEFQKEILYNRYQVCCKSLNYCTSELIQSKPEIVSKEKDTNRLVFLYVGKNSTRTNLNSLVDTFNKFSKGTNHRLIINTDKQGDIKDSDNIELLTDEVTASLYNSCDYVITFTRGEGTGVVILEANYFEKPIIAHDKGIFRDLKNFVNVPWYVLPTREVSISSSDKTLRGTWWDVDCSKSIDILNSLTKNKNIS